MLSRRGRQGVWLNHKRPADDQAGGSDLASSWLTGPTSAPGRTDNTSVLVLIKEQPGKGQGPTENQGTGIHIRVFVALNKLSLSFFIFGRGMMIPIHRLREEPEQMRWSVTGSCLLLLYLVVVFEPWPGFLHLLLHTCAWTCAWTLALKSGTMDPFFLALAPQSGVLPIPGDDSMKQGSFPMTHWTFHTLSVSK